MTYSLKQTVEFDDSNISAFGTLETNELEPVVQLDFVYGINTQTGASTVVQTGVVDTTAQKLRVQTGTNSAGQAIFRSRRIIKYRPGQGVTARFTGVFTTGVANSIQANGVGNETDGYFFGYNGTAFGTCHRLNGTDTFTAQTDWNGDKCNGTGASGFNIDPTKGNVYMIKYPYLGYGTIRFYILNPLTSRWILCHVIQYPNTTTTVQLTNPNLYYWLEVKNTGNTSNIIAYCASVGIFISGHRSFIGNPQWAMDNSKASITTETNIITLKNATTYNGATNRSLIRLNSLSASNSANTTCFVRIKINATLGGTPSYTTINGTTANAGVTITSGNSITSYDTAGTTVTGGNYIFNMSVGPAGMQMIDLTPLNLFIAPGETATFSGSALANTTIGVSVNWSEDI